MLFDSDSRKSLRWVARTRPASAMERCYAEMDHSGHRGSGGDGRSSQRSGGSAAVDIGSAAVDIVSAATVGQREGVRRFPDVEQRQFRSDQSRLLDHGRLFVWLV